MARLIDANNLIQKLRGNVLVDVTTELEKEIENAPTIDPVKQEWVRAKDRLPEKGKSVLVYWDDGFDIGEYVGGEVGDDVYWMPLPEPPEKEK